MRKPIFPLSEYLKPQLIRHLGSFSEFSEWKIAKTGEFWMSTEDHSLAEKIKARINKAGIAKAELWARKDNAAIFVVKCTDLNCTKLFQQNSAAAKVKRLGSNPLEDLEKILAEVLRVVEPLVETGDLALSGPIIKVPKGSKSTLPNWPHYYKTMLVHLREYSSNISYIKVNEFASSIGSTVVTCSPPAPTPGIYLTIKFKDGRKEYYFAYENKLVSLFNEDLRKIALALNIAEFYLRKKVSLLDEGMGSPYPASYWDKDWEVGTKFYYAEIGDPLILDAFTSEVLGRWDKTKILTILDVGAGKGRIAEKILNILNALKIKCRYIFVEPSKAQITIAQEKLAAYDSIRFVNTTVEDLPGDLKVDCIISSGGPLNQKIVSVALAINAIRKLQDILLPGGVLIAMGLTPLLVRIGYAPLLEGISYAVSFVPPLEPKASFLVEALRNGPGFFSGQFQRLVCKRGDAAVAVTVPVPASRADTEAKAGAGSEAAAAGFGR